MRRRQPATRTMKEPRSERRLQRFDLSSGGGLRQSEPTSGGRKAAGMHDFEKRAVQIPFGLFLGHAYLYISSPRLCNSTGHGAARDSPPHEWRLTMQLIDIGGRKLAVSCSGTGPE